MAPLPWQRLLQIQAVIAIFREPSPTPTISRPIGNGLGEVPPPVLLGAIAVAIFALRGIKPVLPGAAPWGIGAGFLVADLGAAIAVAQGSGATDVLAIAKAAEAAVLLLIEVAALAQGFALATFVELHVVELLLRLEGAAGGGLDAALLELAGLAGGQLVLGRHGAAAVALPFLLLPAAAADAEFFQ